MARLKKISPRLSLAFWVKRREKFSAHLSFSFVGSDPFTLSLSLTHTLSHSLIANPFLSPACTFTNVKAKHLELSSTFFYCMFLKFKEPFISLPSFISFRWKPNWINPNDPFLQRLLIFWPQKFIVRQNSTCSTYNSSILWFTIGKPPIRNLWVEN